MCMVGSPPTYIHQESGSSDYCSDSCLIIATSFSKNIRPLLRPVPFCSVYEYYAAKILYVLKAKKECGVPYFSQDIIKIPPWNSNMFSNRKLLWSQNWKFIGSYQIPITLEDFKWIEVRSSTMIGQAWMDVQSEMINQVKHRVFKPFPIEEDDRWELHQFSSPDLMETAVYVMHCSAVAKPKPLRKRKWPQKQSEIDASLSDILKKTTKKPDRKRKWSHKDRLIEEPLLAEDEEPLLAEDE
ncbi:unnamed protein product, partial [Arabidopsis halleri]